MQVQAADRNSTAIVTCKNISVAMIGHIRIRFSVSTPPEARMSALSSS